MSTLSVALHLPFRRVRVVSQSLVDGRTPAVLTLVPDRRFAPLCSGCGQTVRSVHSERRRWIRDLSLGEHEVLLELVQRRLRCSACEGTRMEAHDFVDSHRRVTKRLARYETLGTFFQLMTPAERRGIEAMAMDMCKPYAKAVRVYLPNARIIYDLFHVIANYLNLTESERPRLQSLLDMNAEIATAHVLKDALKEIWTPRSPWDTRRALERWCALAVESRIPALIRFAAQLQRHKRGIIAHARFPINPGRLEGTNNRIKVIKCIAYGFHDPVYFALKVKQASPGQPLCT